MADIPENTLTIYANTDDSDYVRIVGLDGESYRVLVSDLETLFMEDFSAMTLAEATAGTVTEKRVISPKIFKDSALSIVNEDDALLSTTTINLWKSILGIS